jgi:hypothetical protein
MIEQRTKQIALELLEMLNRSTVQTTSSFFLKKNIQLGKYGFVHWSGIG